jgi:hypothetical protein
VPRHGRHRLADGGRARVDTAGIAPALSPAAIRTRHRTRHGARARSRRPRLVT